MTGVLRRRLAALEEAVEHRQAQRYADEFGCDAAALLAGAKRLAVLYRGLLAQGLSQQAAWRQVRERVAAEVGKSLAELDAGIIQRLTRNSAPTR